MDRFPVAVPAADAPWEDVQDFALSYRSKDWTALSAVAGRVRRAWARHGELPDSVDDLRGCLLHEQRRWHLAGSEPAGRASGYVAALVQAIAAAGAGAGSDVTLHLVQPTVATAARDNAVVQSDEMSA